MDNRFYKIGGLKISGTPNPNQWSLGRILAEDLFTHPKSGAKHSHFPKSTKKKFYSQDEQRTLHLVQKRAGLRINQDPTFQEWADRLALDCEELPLHLGTEVLPTAKLDLDVVSERLADLAKTNFQTATQEDIAICLELMRTNADHGNDKFNTAQKIARALLQSHHIDPDMAAADQALAYVDPDPKFERKIRDGFVQSNPHVNIPWAHSDLSRIRQTLGSQQTQTHPDSIAEMLGFKNFRALYDAIAGKTVLDLGSGANTFAKAVKLLDNETGTNTTVININPYRKVPKFLELTSIVVPQSLGIQTTDKSSSWQDQFAEIDRSTVDNYWSNLKSILPASVDFVLSVDSFPKLANSHTESQTTLREIARVLKTGGKFYVSPIFTSAGTTGATKKLNRSSGSHYYIQTFTNAASKAGLVADSPWIRFDQNKLLKRANITSAQGRHSEGTPLGLIFKKS